MKKEIEKDTRVYDVRNNQTIFVGTIDECLDYLETIKQRADYPQLSIADVITEDIFEKFNTCKEFSIQLAKILQENKKVNFQNWIDEVNIPQELREQIFLNVILKDAKKIVNGEKI